MSENHKSIEFKQLSKEDRPSLIADFWLFLKTNKKWWLLPILVVLGLLGILVLLSSSAVAPFIYPLF